MTAPASWSSGSGPVGPARRVTFVFAAGDEEPDSAVLREEYMEQRSRP